MRSYTAYLFFVLFYASSVFAYPKEYTNALQQYREKSFPHVLIIRAKEQTLTHYIHDQEVKTYTISTAEKGLGEKQHSYQTPRGLHRVNRKVGKGEPARRIFRGRKATQQVWNGKPSKKDLILGRMLLLEGLEPKRNQGRNSQGMLVDSEKRFIYIHGTNDVARLGQETSLGCIRMAPVEVIELFQNVPVGTHVYIY